MTKLANERIKSFTLLDEGIVCIKTTRRKYFRKFKTAIDDREYIQFMHQEFYKSDMLRYGINN